MTANELFEKNQSFALWMASKFAGAADYEELRQLALIGLYKAALRFDETKDVKFITYAHHYVRKEIIRHLETWRNIHVSRHVVERSKIVKRLDYENMTMDQIMKETGFTEKEIQQVFRFINLSVSSIEGQAYNKDNSITLGETIMAQREDWDEQIIVKDFMKSLNEADSRIVTMRLAGKSQGEIGAELGVSQMQISRALKRIKGKLQTCMA